MTVYRNRLDDWPSVRRYPSCCSSIRPASRRSTCRLKRQGRRSTAPGNWSLSWRNADALGDAVRSFLARQAPQSAHGSDWSWMNSRSSRRTASHRWANVRWVCRVSQMRRPSIARCPVPCDVGSTGQPTKLIYADEDGIRGHVLRSVGSSLTEVQSFGFRFRSSPQSRLSWRFPLVSAQLLAQAGPLASQALGAERHDLVLRLIEQLDPAQIHHVPRVLYHCNAVRGASDLDVSEGDCAQSNSIRAVGAFFSGMA